MAANASESSGTERVQTGQLAQRTDLPGTHRVTKSSNATAIPETSPGRLRNTGHAVILISHRMPDVSSVADRVAVLRRGIKVADKPIAATSPEEVTGLITGAVETA